MPGIAGVPQIMKVQAWISKLGNSDLPLDEPVAQGHDVALGPPKAGQWNVPSGSVADAPAAGAAPGLEPTVRVVGQGRGRARSRHVRWHCGAVGVCAALDPDG